LIMGGPLDGFPVLIGYQMVSIVVIGAWSFIVSCIILFVINLIMPIGFSHPELKRKSMSFGGDAVEMAESAYNMNLWVGGVFNPASPASQEFSSATEQVNHKA